jgi:hypothetical protein
MDGGIFISLPFIPNFFVGQIDFSGAQQRLLLAGGPSLLPFSPFSYDLSLIIDIYP